MSGLLSEFLYSSGTVGTEEPVCFTEFIQGFLHFRSFDCTQTYINAFGTKQSVHNTVDGHFSGVSIGQGSSLIAIFTGFLHFSFFFCIITEAAEWRKTGKAWEHLSCE